MQANPVNYICISHTQTRQLLHLWLGADCLYLWSHLCRVTPIRLDAHVLRLGIALGWVTRAWGWAILPLYPWGWNGLLHGCLHACNTLSTDAHNTNAMSKLCFCQCTSNNRQGATAQQLTKHVIDGVSGPSQQHRSTASLPGRALPGCVAVGPCPWHLVAPTHPAQLTFHI